MSRVDARRSASASATSARCRGMRDERIGRGFCRPQVVVARRDAAALANVDVGRRAGGRGGAISRGLGRATENAATRERGALSETSISARARGIGMRARRGDVMRTDARTSDGAAGEVEVKPKVSNLMTRTFSSLLMGAVGLTVIFAGGWPWVIAMAMFNGASATEYFGMVSAMRKKEAPYPPPPWCVNVCVAACSAMPLILHFSNGRMTFIVATTVIALFLIFAALIVNEESHFNEFSSSLFGLVYAGFLPTFWVKLRGMSGVALNSPGSLIHLWPSFLGGPDVWTLGLAATLTIVLAVVAADVGAYAAGKTLGKNKLTRVSPNKTVEGAVGGLLACTGTCAGLFVVMGWPGTPLQGALLGVMVFLTSIFGDLLESVMKRNADMKDSGNLIPGHGGLLDRFDSYIFTGSVTYFFVIAVLGGFRRVFSVGYY